jgi:hypothetical protein
VFKALKRRNVVRVGIAYLVTAWLVIQVVETIFPAFGFCDGVTSSGILCIRHVRHDQRLQGSRC